MKKGITVYVIVVILCLVGVHSQTVPDNVVWTPPTKTLWLGQSNPHVTCQFQGTPYAVYWMKGSTPGNADEIVTWYKGSITYGTGISATKFDIDRSSFALMFKDLVESDSGRYICRVSNHRGFLIHNHTDVRVLDPQNVIAYTKPNVTTWKGSKEYLPCDFQGVPIKVLWNKIDETRQPPTVETVLKYADDTFEVVGSNRFSWSSDFGLNVRDIEVMDEGNYTCKVWKSDGIELQNSTTVTVNARAEEPYVKIKKCVSKSSDRTCTYDVVDDNESFTLECSVSGAKPHVLDIWWSEGATERVTNNSQVTHIKQIDGTVNSHVTLSKELSTIVNGTKFICSATGMAVNGTWNQTAVIRVIPAPPAPHPTAKASTTGLSAAEATILSIFLIILIIACCVGGSFILYRYHKEKLEAVLPPRVLRICACWDRNSTYEKQGSDEEKTPLTDPAEEELEEKRGRILNYVPGNTTHFQFPDNTTLNIGLFGVMSAGKSAFINSLHFSLTGEYKVVSAAASPEKGGSSTTFRQVVPLTKRLNTIDTRGTKDLDKNKINDLLDEIRGKRGQDTKSKVSGGKEIHCPVFVCKASDKAGFKEGLNFLQPLSDEIHKEMGRHILVVITHKDLLEKEEERSDERRKEGTQNKTETNAFKEGEKNSMVEQKGEEVRQRAEEEKEDAKKISKGISSKLKLTKISLPSIRVKKGENKEVPHDEDEKEKLNVDDNATSEKPENKDEMVKAGTSKGPEKNVSEPEVQDESTNPEKTGVLAAQEGVVSGQHTGESIAEEGEDGEENNKRGTLKLPNSLQGQNSEKKKPALVIDEKEKINEEKNKKRVTLKLPNILKGQKREKKEKINEDRKEITGKTPQDDEENMSISQKVTVENSEEHVTPEEIAKPDESVTGDQEVDVKEEKDYGTETNNEEKENDGEADKSNKGKSTWRGRIPNPLKGKENKKSSKKESEEKISVDEDVKNTQRVKTDEAPMESKSDQKEEMPMNVIKSDAPEETPSLAECKIVDENATTSNISDGKKIEPGEKSDNEKPMDKANALSSLKRQIHLLTNIPENNVWAFENYTDEKHGEDPRRSIEFLDFVLACIDNAERNFYFREEYMREQKEKKHRSIIYKATHPNKLFV